MFVAETVLLLLVISLTAKHRYFIHNKTGVKYEYNTEHMREMALTWPIFAYHVTEIVVLPYITEYSHTLLGIC